MSSMKFVVSHMDQQMGPFDEQELKSKWAKGEILPIDYIYDESQQDWVMLAEKFGWAKAEEVEPPPPVRTDSVVTRKMPLSLSTVTTVATPPAPAAAANPAASNTAPMQRLHTAAKPEQIKFENRPIAEEIKLETVIPAPAQAAKRPTGTQPAKVKLVDGMGEIDLSPLNPGKVELLLQDSNAMLKMQEPHRIQIKPAEPVEIVWSVANQQVCGNELEVSLKALDDNGNLCLHYTDSFVIQIRGGASPRDITVTTTDGQTTFKLANTKAETWTITLAYSGTKNIKLPEMRSLEWHPGPASRLVLDGPHEYMAGIPLKVQVKAVDAFGNVAKNFQGTVTLEVKAS
jgi:hypothetical protein